MDVIRGEGMPVFGSDLHGDLYVEYKVVLPVQLSPKMRRSKSILPLVSRQTINPPLLDIDRAFNGGYRDDNGRDEL